MEVVALQVLALLGYGAFLLATFGWRTVRARRASGESGWREPVSRTDAIGEAICVAGFLVTLAAPPLALAGRIRPLRTEWPAVQGFLVLAVMFLGTALALWAQDHLADEWRAGVEASASLVTDGPFARIRNPFYVGCFLASAAVLLAVPSGVALLGLTLHIVAAEVIVRGVEEPILFEAHGDEFSQYKRRTGRFLPRL